jgi:hypothetical protein
VIPATDCIDVVFSADNAQYEESTECANATSQIDIFDETSYTLYN